MQAHPVSPESWLLIAPLLLSLGGAALLVVLRGLPAIQRWAGLLILLAILWVDWRLVDHVLTSRPLAMTMGN